MEDLVDACSDALYDMEGIRKGVSTRTVQGDLQMMRSDKLGYNAPIEVYDQMYYRYSDPDYSINDMPLSEEDILLFNRALVLLKKSSGERLDSDLCGVLSLVEKRLSAIMNYG